MRPTRAEHFFSGGISFMKKILITGGAGFIGFHLSKRLLGSSNHVVCVDNMNDYYDVSLKRDRVALIENHPNYRFHKVDIADRKGIAELFSAEKFDIVVNLAAQPGVRYSLKNPYSYVDSNVVGFLNVLEGCRHNNVKHLVFASSSSIYGANTRMPFSVHHKADHSVSLYAATKKANELMAHSYASLYGIPVTGLRFFTVYGPWGRPDMAYFSFTNAIVEGKPIDVFNNGDMKRDFTYIDDIIEGTVRVIDKIPQANPNWNGTDPDPATSYAPYRIYNIGNNQPVDLMYFIKLLEQYLGRETQKNLLPMQAGDVYATYADIEDLTRDTGFKPVTTLEQGLKKFVDWYRGYYRC